MNAPELRFDAAINPYGPSPRVVEAMVAFARSREYRFYGDDLYAEPLRERIGAHLGVPPASVLVYNGAGEALVWQFLVHLLLPKGWLLVPYPSYERFVALGKRCAAEVIDVPLTPDDYALDVDRMLAAAVERSAAAVLVSNPNNPTGNRLLDADTLTRLLDALPTCLWFVDEAYADYGGQTFAGLSARHPNLIVLRTFSKAYGLAGMRVGYCVSHPEMAKRVAAFQIPWAVDSMALVAAEAALEDQEYLREVVARVRRDCDAFGSALRGVPYLRVYPTDANFFLLRLDGVEPAAVQRALDDAGIKVRQRPDMPNHLRVTCMLPQDNARLVEVLRASDAGSLGVSESAWKR
ncbi:histidinol-phosphate aminotransferase family protein [Candidatus Poribacteria bacterium]|nr:histidinol-phosphate aminotransferase family protein [Candidatus Poribacteria bacterium]